MSPPPPRFFIFVQSHPWIVSMSQGRSDCLSVWHCRVLCFYLFVLLHGFIVTDWFVCTCHCLMSSPLTHLIAWWPGHLLHFVTGPRNLQLGFWEWHRRPMVWFNGWDQPPGWKVKDEETDTEKQKAKKTRRETKRPLALWSPQYISIRFQEK